MRARSLIASLCLLGACASTTPKGPPDSECTFEEHLGICDLVVVLDPRESEDPSEATTLELRWSWKGARPTDVLPLIKRWSLTAQEAYRLASVYSDIDQARCLAREATAPLACQGRNRVIHIESPTK